MKNPQSGSNEFAPPSPAAKRRKGEYSDWDEKPPIDYSDESECSDDERPRGQCQLFRFINDEFARRFGDREVRRVGASAFFESLDTTVSRFCIEPGACSFSTEKSFNITWVAVHGVDSICVVIGNEDLVRLEQEMRTPRVDKRYFRSHIWNALISIVEDIAGLPCESCQMCNKRSKKRFGLGPSGEPCQMLHMSGKKPFGVVSVIGGTDMVHKASSAECGVTKALEFVLEEMGSVTALTFDKTTETAISAFQLLFRQKFEADELQVFVLKNNEFVGRELKLERERPLGIDEVLSNINGA